MKYKLFLCALLSLNTMAFVQAQNNTQPTDGATNLQQDTTNAGSGVGTSADSTSINSADTTASTEINDEDLRKYAVAMDSVDNMKKRLLSDISQMVKGNEKIKTARYNELSKIINDEAKLAEAKATPEEINFIKGVVAKKEEGTNAISQTFQTLAREYIGVEEYNRIKTALAEDSALKARYDTILKEVDEDDDTSNK